MMAGFDDAQMTSMLARDSEEGDQRGSCHVYAASVLIGYRVRNWAGEDLGSIEEIVIDALTGRVAYAMLSFGGFLGFGVKLFAIPWHALALNEPKHEFRLNANLKMLENAPGFWRRRRVNVADPESDRLSAWR